jgi:ribosomal protein L11 methyltransferase
MQSREPGSRRACLNRSVSDWMIGTKTYLEITIPASGPVRELLIPQLLEIGCHGFLETDSSLVAYIDRSLLTGNQYADLGNRLTGILKATRTGTAFDIREMKDEDWNLQWEQSIEPVEIGTRLVIEPSWRRHAYPDGKVVLEIDPKMSFGTGHHESTRLCLTLLESNMRPDDLVLDVGTGTGILAIAAVKLGARSAVGIDIDEWSIENAHENVKANHVEKSVRIVRASLEDFRGGVFDCILANLTFNLIRDSLPRLRELLSDNGFIVISGFLDSDLAPMQECLTRHCFGISATLEEHGWSALAARKA